MFNKFAKTIRWIVLAGMLYTLYTITIRDDVEFNNQTDEKVLVEMAEKASKNRDLFLIYQQLASLYPEKQKYQDKYLEIVKVQANAIIDAHEKMLIPMPKGNYRYVKNIEFAEDDDKNFALILTMTTIFDKKLDTRSQTTLKKMFMITHRGIYEHYGFDNSFKLLLVPTFDTTDNVHVIDLNRTLSPPEFGVDVRYQAP